MPNTSAKNTDAVIVTFTLQSSLPDPPFYIRDCNAEIVFDDQTKDPQPGWEHKVGKPGTSGANFSVRIVNTDHQLAPSSVMNWAVTFIPSGATTAASPFGNNQNTISGKGAGSPDATTTLDLKKLKIKNAGTWDWSVLVQVKLQDGTVKCFASDPKMEVDA